MNSCNVTLRNENAKFLGNHKTLGFENESAMVGFAIKFLKQEIEKQNENLVHSFTNLFIDIYKPENVLAN